MPKIVKKIVFQIAKCFGFSIHRNRYVKLQSYSDAKPLYVEFVGVSGVGKTTLFKNLNKNKRKTDWIHSRQFVLAKHDMSIKDQISSVSFYQDLIENKVEQIVNKTYQPFDQLDLFKYNYYIIRDDALAYLYNKHHTLLCEDGLLHNFGSGIESVYRKDYEKFKVILRNRAVVYCYASAEVVAGRILKRKNEIGELRPQHKKVGAVETLIETERVALDKMEQFVNILKEQIPVLKINTEDAWELNKQKIDRFISELKNRS